MQTAGNTEQGLGRKKWIGYVLDWQQRYIFGRPKECPLAMYMTCWADTPEQASFILHRKAYKLGYALGGVRSIREWQQTDGGIPKSQLLS